MQKKSFLKNTTRSAQLNTVSTEFPRNENRKVSRTTLIVSFRDSSWEGNYLQTLVQLILNPAYSKIRKKRP